MPLASSCGRSSVRNLDKTSLRTILTRRRIGGTLQMIKEVVEEIMGGGVMHST